MRHNNRQKPSNILDRYDRVYVEIPQCPWMRSIVAAPLKTIYYNRSAARGANIDRLFADVWDLQDFLTRHRIVI